MSFEFVTFTDISRETGARDHRIRHAIRRLEIKPLQKVGSSYLYPPDTIEKIKLQFQKWDNRRLA